MVSQRQWCSKCRGSGWVQPIGYAYQERIGYYAMVKIAPPHQCANCCGEGWKRDDADVSEAK